MNYLVDTNVLSEPKQKRPESKVVNWLKANEASLYTSVLVTGEIRYGIELLPANSAKRVELLKWHDELLDIMAGRVLSINARVADEWGRLQAEARAKNLVLPVVDSLLAATARRYQLVLATDNTSDFRGVGLKIVNPFD
ncbi:MAG: type II toxin-antitoxin system VapC family toxin [Verrucomicrobiota bacterium]|nr:type II toxin-antitoxin system VapC family toxin [Verrucomicrobiota bacterium]